MPRHSEAVAKSYAKALFELARERNQVDAIGKELDTIAATVGREPALLTFLSRPWTAAAAKRGAITELATRLGLSQLTRDFLGLVAARNRADHLLAIARAFRAYEDQSRGRLRVKLRTAIALTDAEREALRTRLTRMLEARELVLDESVDPTLLWGFVAEVGSRVLDGSLDTQLERLRDQLARA